MLAGGAWLKRGAAKRWLLVGAAGAVVVAAGASVAVALGGNRAPAPPHNTTAASSTPAPKAAPKPAPCATWGCTRAQRVDLGGGYALSLWHAGKVGDQRAEPVLELSRDGVSVQWWRSPDGFGWTGELRCSVRAPEPNCMLTDGTGAHSAMAQLLVLRAGRLVAPAQAHVVADLPTVVARDLDGDGYLDVAAVMSDYTPNFAQGHQFWNTFVFAGGQFHSTGCAPKDDAVPTGPLTGSCPAR